MIASEGESDNWESGFFPERFARRGPTIFGAGACKRRGAGAKIASALVACFVRTVGLRSYAPRAGACPSSLLWEIVQ